MQTVFSLPLAVQDPVEHLLLHPVLGFHPKDITYPHPTDADSETAEDQDSHVGNSPVERAGLCMRCHVDGVLHRPYLCQADGHVRQS